MNLHFVRKLSKISKRFGPRFFHEHHLWRQIVRKSTAGLQICYASLGVRQFIQINLSQAFFEEFDNLSANYQNKRFWLRFLPERHIWRQIVRKSTAGLQICYASLGMLQFIQINLSQAFFYEFAFCPQFIKNK